MSSGPATRGRRRRLRRDGTHRALVRDLVRPYRPRVVLLAAMSFLGGATEALFLVVITRTGLAIADGADRAELIAGRSLPVGAAIASAAGLLVVRLMFAIGGVWLSTGIAFDVLTGLRRRLADAYLDASWAVQQAEPAGQLQNLANFAQNAMLVVNAFSSSLAASLSLASLIAIALIVSPLATLAVIVALGVLGSLLAPIRRRIRARSRAAAAAQGVYGSALTELGALGLEMQTLGARPQFGKRLEALSQADGVARRQALLAQGLLAPIYTSLAYVALLGALGVAAFVGAGELSAVGAVMLVMLRSLAYGQQLQAASGNLNAAAPYLESLNTTLQRYESNRATGGTSTLTSIAPIDARNVSFTYPSGRPVLHDLTFTIAPNEIVGIVGPSGSGKSTLVQLLLGLRDPVSGTIRVAGHDLREVDRHSWTERVAFVPQDAQLFTGTIAENIRFFRDGLTNADVARAAEQANLLPDMRTMPDGFATYLGERGAQLSGGQRQRVSIARALAGNPELLILDEPTSALDTRSETLIRETIARLRGQVTTVIIAHRMSTLDVCDRIMVIESGRITALDTSSALSERSEFYRSAMQLSGLA